MTTATIDDLIIGYMNAMYGEDIIENSITISGDTAMITTDKYNQFLSMQNVMNVEEGNWDRAGRIATKMLNHIRGLK